MAYILGTTHPVIRFYVFTPNEQLNESAYSIIDTLDTTQIPMAGNKETAKTWAQAMGLKTWSYIKL